MPQRFLRPGLTTSARFNALDWQAQSLYVRLITLVDDFGRFDAHPMLLKSLAFPFNPEIICEQMFSLCNQLSVNGLAEFYEHDGKQFLQLLRWQENARSKSKFPDPKNPACKHLQTFANKCLSPSSSSSPSSSPSPLSGKPDEAKGYHPDSRTVLHLLNELSGKHFRETDSNLTFISQRLQESGIDLAGIRQMIDRQVKRWKGTPQAEYLRPETLFNKTKFDGYYAARGEPILTDSTPRPASKMTNQEILKEALS